MSKKLYINKPGGVILQMASGLSESYEYGQEVEIDDVSDNQRGFLDRLTSTKRPDEAPNASPFDNSLRAAEVEVNNINTTASPIPGNYSELSEDEAVRLITGCRDPQVQAVLVAYEIQTQGRSKVVNAAPEGVQSEAEVRAAVSEWETEQLASSIQGNPTEDIDVDDAPGAGPGDNPPVAPPIPGATPAPTGS